MAAAAATTAFTATTTTATAFCLLLSTPSYAFVTPSALHSFKQQPQQQSQQPQSPLFQSSFTSDKDLVTSSSATDAQTSTSTTATTTASTTAVVVADESTLDVTTAAAAATMEQSSKNKGWFAKLYDKMGTIDQERLVFPELYEAEDTTRMFSSLQYRTTTTTTTEVDTAAADTDNKQQQQRLVATHQGGSVIGAAALVAGTTIGAGILALPTATAATGFVPSTAALLSAWIYMTMSGLLIAELTLNRLVETGKPGQGLLELYKQQSPVLATAGVGAYFFLHYAMMVAYIAQGGNNLVNILENAIVGSDVAAATTTSTAAAANTMQQLVHSSLPEGTGQAVFCAIVACSLLATNAAVLEQINNILVLAVFATFAAIVGIGAQTADFGALFASANQHPELVVNCLPILFLALVYQNVVPTVVTQLEGDRTKITQAVMAGTTLPMLMFIAWNAVVLGNVVASGSGDAVADPIALLQAGAGSTTTLLAPLVTAFSSLAILTSMVGFTYGLVDAWTDVFQIPAKGKEFEQSKLPLFALIFLPPLTLSVANPDIFYQALEYGGAFGVSTLFLVLPPIMVWQQRYVSDQPLATKPMVPFGKLPLGSMWKVAATLMLEQTADKLGIFDFVREHITLPQLF